MFEIELTEPQTKFLLNDSKFPLFVAGYGAGKSTIMAVSIFNDFNYFHDKPIKIAAYAPTYDLLSLITVPYLSEMMEESQIKFRYHGGSHIFTLETGDQIICRSLDNPARIVGYQTFRAHIDEIDTIPQDKANDAWNKVAARNRQFIPKRNEEGDLQFIEASDHNTKYADYVLNDNGIYVKVERGEGTHVIESEKNRVSAYSTPEGFAFTYERWIEDKKSDEEIEPEKETAKGYWYIRAPTYSNPYLQADYIQGLRDTYPEELVDAYIEGLHVNLTGTGVYKRFDKKLNGSQETVQPYDVLEVGMDFNVVHGAAVIHIIRDGLPHAVDEIHDAYDTDDQIRVLKNRYPNHVINVYPDATGGRRTSANTVESDIAKLHGAGFNVFHDYSNPPIKERVNSLNAMICNGKQERRYFVNSRECPNLVNTFHKQVWDTNGLPDKSQNLDHIADAAGYYIHKVFPIIKPVAGAHAIQGGY